jgi:hypothetical protein
MGGGSIMPKITTDVLFMADHFVLVTTVETDYSPDNRDIEKAALKRLADEYSDEFVAMLKSATKRVSIEVVQETPEPTINDVNKSMEESNE